MCVFPAPSSDESSLVFTSAMTYGEEEKKEPVRTLRGPKRILYEYEYSIDVRPVEDQNSDLVTNFVSTI